MLSKMNYDDIVTRVTLWVSASISLTDYINNRILCDMEPGDTKSLILGLYHNTNELGNKIDILLFNASLYGTGPGKLEKLYDLTGKYLEALQMLYMTIGRDEYDQQMTYLKECVSSPDYRETAEDLLEPFYTGN